jgi:hypothetical protein
MPEIKTAEIEKKLIEVLQSKKGPAEAEKVINDAQQNTGADEWDVRNALWRLTADGKASFTSGFKMVSLP